MHFTEVRTPRLGPERSSGREVPSEASNSPEAPLAREPTTAQWKVDQHETPENWPTSELTSGSSHAPCTNLAVTCVPSTELLMPTAVQPFSVGQSTALNPPVRRDC